MITYEYPFNERIRTLLRLEDLFDKAAYFLQAEGSHEHHVVLVTLFEILEVAGRADLKMDLIQELERQRQTLLVFRNNPDISEEALSGALYEIEQSSAALLGMTGKIGQYLRENDWLMGIKSRAAIPGGVCEFDLPSYHFWLNRDGQLRQRDLQGWVAPMLAINQAIGIVATAALAVVMTFVILKVVGLVTGGLRVDDEAEEQGLDISQHGEEAYNS